MSVNPRTDPQHLVLRSMLSALLAHVWPRAYRLAQEAKAMGPIPEQYVRAVEYVERKYGEVFPQRKEAA